MQVVKGFGSVVGSVVAAPFKLVGSGVSALMSIGRTPSKYVEDVQEPHTWHSKINDIDCFTEVETRRSCILQHMRKLYNRMSWNLSLPRFVGSGDDIKELTDTKQLEECYEYGLFAQTAYADTVDQVSNICSKRSFIRCPCTDHLVWAAPSIRSVSCIHLSIIHYPCMHLSFGFTMANSFLLANVL